MYTSTCAVYPSTAPLSQNYRDIPLLWKPERPTNDRSSCRTYMYCWSNAPSTKHKHNTHTPRPATWQSWEDYNFMFPLSWRERLKSVALARWTQTDENHLRTTQSYLELTPTQHRTPFYAKLLSTVYNVLKLIPSTELQKWSRAT